ncbi:MAG TPA: hypothetical protein PLN34_07960 [Alloprevotella sp.]|nr:hypothetical protein [Alloprevotella sp.]
MINTLILLTTEFAAVAHLMMSLVLFYFARRSVRFLSQAWIMLLIGILYGVGLCFVAVHDIPSPGILHPVMLIYLLACSYLQSIYPLGMCMPGYLQWGRMWGYATPALALIFIYSVGAAMGSNLAKVYEAADIPENLLSGDVLLRLTALGLSGYYIINIFRLPHKLVRRFELPPDLAVYGAALGLVAVYFIVLTIRFSLVGLMLYMVLFTVVNMFFFFRILRPVSRSMVLPAIQPVKAPPPPNVLSMSELDDFNEANLHRFEVMEYKMQTERPYVDPLFNRESLCGMTGFNRHVVLQSLRSQGYNDIHEYIARYRVAELKKQIIAGRITDLKQHGSVGFRALKTAQSCFERYEGGSLIEWFREHAPGADTSADDGGENT